jgi:hypothetical protein
MYILAKVKRCCDRRCRCDNHNTNQVIQEDFEAMYMGPEFLFEDRYASLLTSLFVCLFLSFGMPLFYFVGILNFWLVHLFDKYLCK